MAQPATSGPDPSKPSLSATGVLRARPDNVRFETDFAKLAACFSQSGSGLSPELSTDLALEIVLNEVVEQACLTTGATGAAIALERDGEMVCRASSGATSPALGSRMDAASGISLECIRMRQTQRCDDVLADSRVGHEVWQRLGVRSVMVIPLLRATELMGLFELFSSQPQAFGERDERTLEALAVRILSSLERADQPLPPPPGSEPVPAPETQVIAEVPDNWLPESLTPENSTLPGSPERGSDLLAWSLRAAVVVFAVLLGLLLGRHFGAPSAAVRPRPVAHQSVAGNRTATSRLPIDASTPRRQEGTAAQQSTTTQQSGAVATSASAKGNEKAAPPGSLLVFENGKEIFRMPPQQSEAGGSETAPSRTESSLPGEGSGQQLASSAEPEKAVDVSSSTAEGSLLHRVEPTYPEDALQQKIQGPVVLQVHIGRDGAVQEVQVVSGPPELAQASTDAVKQWSFKPLQVNGRAVPMQTRITLNFSLPQ